MGIELVIIGLDGVIFDTEALHWRACNEAFKNRDIEACWSLQQWREAGRIWGATNAIVHFAHESPSPSLAPLARDLLNEKNRVFHELISDSTMMRSRAYAQLIEDVLEHGCKLAVVTDMPARSATALLERAFGDAVNNVLAVVVTDADFNAQPDFGPYHLTRRTVDVDARSCAVIHSGALSLAAAQRAGIWTTQDHPLGFAHLKALKSNMPFRMPTNGRRTDLRPCV